MLAACSDDKKTATTTASGAGTPKPSISIGAQDFGESKILAEIYKQVSEPRGSRRAFRPRWLRDLEMTAFQTQTINFAPEYAAAMLEFLNARG